MKTNSCYEQVIIAGFGGQGIILLGRLLAQTAMKANKEVTYMPAYGAEVRGGTSNCTIIIADEPIATPTVEKADSLIVMNKASVSKFGPRLKTDGLLIVNSSLVDFEALAKLPETITVVAVPADELAVELGNQKTANMVALGAYLARKDLFSVDAAAQCLPETIAKRYHHTLEVNNQALQRGAQFAKAQTAK